MMDSLEEFDFDGYGDVPLLLPEEEEELLGVVEDRREFVANCERL